MTVPSDYASDLAVMPIVSLSYSLEFVQILGMGPTLMAIHYSFIPEINRNERWLQSAQVEKVN